MDMYAEICLNKYNKKAKHIHAGMCAYIHTCSDTYQIIVMEEYFRKIKEITCDRGFYNQYSAFKLQGIEKSFKQASIPLCTGIYLSQQHSGGGKTLLQIWGYIKRTSPKIPRAGDAV